jgi:serine/threonine protein kinase
MTINGAGVLHRHVRPDNIYLSGVGAGEGLDFGAARYALSQQSRSLSIILKQGYAPEEQYRPKGNQGPWTDADSFFLPG